jgi:1-acyl-sn-glycerol-3-phosphate acyltransferase
MPPSDGTWRRIARRSVTVPLYLAATVLLTIAAPALLPVCWLVALRRNARGALRTYLFSTAYLWAESIGIAVSGWLWLRHGCATRRSRRWNTFLTANFALQCAWAGALKRAAEALFALRFTITGSAALDGSAALMLARHASIADTVIPMVCYATPRRIRLRYVLKRELLLDPCLDIVGNRLPNCFVTRRGDPADIDRLTLLARDLSADEGLLIYPEGTRFSTARRERAIATLAEQPNSNDLEMARRWYDLLPPRLAGAQTLAATSGRDLLFCAHVGFEGASHFRSLVNGSWLGADVRIHFWRVPAADVPTGVGEFHSFLFAQWDRMQETLTRLRDDRTHGKVSLLR